jgi:D-alanine--poly(phosphoribitol) ligase subunit 1
MADLVEQLQQSFHRNSGMPFHRLGNSVMSYGELGRASGAIAAFLAATVPRKEPVMIVGEREHEMLACIFGCVRAGNPYVPTGEQVPAARVLEMARIAGCKHILLAGQCELGEAAGFIVHGPAELKRLIAEGTSLSGWDRGVRGDEILYVLFTSGSTGAPKGVLVSAGNVESFLSWTKNGFGYSEGPLAFLNQAPFHFDLSVYELYNAAISGGSLLSLPSRLAKDPERLFGQLFQYADTLEVWVSTPSFLRYCASHAEFQERRFPRLQQFVQIGEVFPVPLARECLSRFPRARVFNFYGPTEATVAHTVFEVTRQSIEGRSELPVGRSKPDGRVLLEGGEIILAGPNVAWGYAGESFDSAGKFETVNGERRYRTGDLGEWDADGLLLFRGRRDSQVKVNGHRVELGEIERELSRVSGVEICCVGFTSVDGGPWLTAYVQAAQVTDEDELAFGKRLKRALAERLPAYMIPKRIIRVAEMPINVNGKIDRASLRENH